MIRLRLFFIVLIFLGVAALCNAGDYTSECSKLFIGFYQGVMSPVRSPASQCQFEPSCSEYAKLSIEEYGLPIGTILAADRLMRCSGGNADPAHYPYFARHFHDSPAKNFVFGRGGLWSLGISSAPVFRKKGEIADSSLKFPYYLFQQKNYSYSNLELMRIRFANSNNLLSQKSGLLIGLNEFLQKNNLKAFDALAEIGNVQDKDLKLDYFLLTFIVADAMNLNAYNSNICEKYCSEFDSLLIGRFAAYSNFKDEELPKALTALEKSRNFLGAGACDSIIDFMKDKIGEKSRSPLLAGILSAILPGAGYAYTGQYKEGASALLINGLLGLGIYELFKNGNTGSGVLTCMVAAPFYFGNIIGSANSAQIENNKLAQENLGMLRAKLRLNVYFSFEQLEEFWK